MRELDLAHGGTCPTLGSPTRPQRQATMIAHEIIEEGRPTEDRSRSRRFGVAIDDALDEPSIRFATDKRQPFEQEVKALPKDVERFGDLPTSGGIE